MVYTPATPNEAQRTFSVDDFRAWLPSSGHTGVIVTRNYDRWSALYVEFNIAGAGNSQVEALEDARKLFWAYLTYCFLDGRSFEASYKPIPRRLRAWYWVLARFFRLKRRVSSFVEVSTTFDKTFFSHPPHVTS